jgi:hypothetical protein
MAWFKRFAAPITLPNGRRELMTMQDAAEYITALPEAERNAPEWQIALEAVTLVAKRNGSELLARMAMLQALKRAKPAPEPTPRWKAVKKFRIVR